MQWAIFFYVLRDGQPGLVLEVRHRRGIVGAEIISLTNRRTEEFINMVEKKATGKWKIVRPIFPNPEAWEQLKKASTVPELRRAAGRIRRWARAMPGVDWKEAGIGQPLEFFHFSRVIRRHAIELLRAKQMRNYPRERPTNDDKRIVFFAKVMAGLSLGIAPATATKRLGHCRWAKAQMEKMFKALELRYPMPKTKSSEQEKRK